jgi:hypothetical protein
MLAGNSKRAPPFSMVDRHMSHGCQLLQGFVNRRLANTGPGHQFALRRQAATNFLTFRDKTLQAVKDFVRKFSFGDVCRQVLGRISRNCINWAYRTGRPP